MFNNQNFNNNRFNSASVLGNNFNADINTSESSYSDDPLDIDTNIQQLSSRKLWQVLQLCQLKDCHLEADFIQEVRQELILRGDFDDGKAWAQPH